MDTQDFESDIASLKAAFLQAAQDRQVAVGALIETCLRIAAGAAVVMGVEDVTAERMKELLKAVTAARDAGVLARPPERKH